MNSSKGFKNIFWGIIAQVITIGLGIIIPRLVLINLGSESNGLLNSISSVLSYMALLEAGVGTATLQALYKPIGKNDKDSINSIMAATNYFYKRTGYIYLALVGVFSVIYSLCVHSNIPRYQVFLIIIMSGLSGVLNYLIQGKYKILLTAEGKNYITTNINTIVTIGVNLTKALVLIWGGNIVAVQSVYFIFNLVQLSCFVIYIKKNYKWLDLKVKPNVEAISQRKYVLLQQITGLIFSNTDSIILTFMVSLEAVSVYSMYMMIFGMVKSVAVTLYDGFTYALGQSYHNREKFLPMFDTYEVYNLSITNALFCIATILLLPFFKLYTAGVEDINYVDKWLLYMFAAYYLLHNGRSSSANVINFAQHFKQTSGRAIAEVVINIVSSIVLTYFFGIYGVVLGTVIALLYRTNDMIIYSARLLNRTPLITYRRWIVNIVLFVSIYFASTFIKVNLDSYLNMIIYGIILSVCVLTIFLGVNSLLEPKSAKYAINVLKNKFLSKKN